MPKKSAEHPGFEGALEFEMSFELLGKRVTRRAKAVYEFTPEWEYFDPRTKSLHHANEHLSYQLKILAVPEEFHEGTMTLVTPYWVEMSDLHQD